MRLQPDSAVYSEPREPLWLLAGRANSVPPNFLVGFQEPLPNGGKKWEKKEKKRNERNGMEKPPQK